jgi:hypothetical protein
MFVDPIRDIYEVSWYLLTFKLVNPDVQGFHDLHVLSALDQLPRR